MLVKFMFNRVDTDMYILFLFLLLCNFRSGNGSPGTANVVVVVLVLGLLLVLRLFHFTTDRRQTSHTDWRQHYPQSHRVGFSS